MTDRDEVQAQAWAARLIAITAALVVMGSMAIGVAGAVALMGWLGW